MIESLLSLCIGSLLGLSMIGLGAAVVHRWFASLSDPLEQVVLAAGLGAGIMSILVLAVGFLGWLYSWVIWGLVFVGLLMGIVVYGHHARAGSLSKWIQKPGSPRDRVSRWGIRVLGVLIAAVLVSDVVAALAPPSYGDTINAYLALPKLYAKEHKLYFTWTQFSGFPAGIQALTTAGLLLRNGRVAQLVSIFLGLVGAGGLYLIARRHLRLPTEFALVGLLLYTSLSSVTLYMPTAKPDIGLACFAILGLYTLLTWEERGERRWLFLCAVFAGLAISAKSHGLFVLAALGICVLIILVMQKGYTRLRESFFLLAAFGIVALLVGSPSYIRNWVWTGNPLWPMLNDVFNGCCLSPQIGTLLKILGQPPTGTNLGDLLLGPWRLMTNIEYFENINHVAVPALLALIPGLVLVPYAKIKATQHTKKAIILLLVYSIVCYLLWYFNRPRAHYLHFLWPALALLAAFSIRGLVARSRVVAWATWTVVAVSIVFNLGLTGLTNSQFVSVVFGLETPDQFLQRNTWYYEDLQYVNRTLDDNARILSFPMGTFYLDRDYIPASINVQSGIVDFFSLHSSDALLARWQELGITHVLWDEYWFEGDHRMIEKYGMRWDLPEQLAQLIEQGHLIPIYDRSVQIPTSRSLETSQASRVILYEVRY
jgi:hypothetical protein